jgi:hypothetical protein
MLSVHEDPLAIVAPHVLPLTMNSLALLLAIATPTAFAVPLLVIVTATDAVVAPTLVAGNETGDGETWKIGTRAGRGVTV